MGYRHDNLAQADLMTVIYELYASEINVSISCFWDAGWEVKLGDEMNGFCAEKCFENGQLHHAGRWLAEEAVTFYPDSEFALKYMAAMMNRKAL